MKNKLFIVVIIILGSTLFSKSIDVVYLNNGGIIKGEIIEMIPSESIKIQTADGSVFVYMMDEVTKIENESIQELTSEEFQQQIEKQNKNVYLKVLIRSLISVVVIVLLTSAI